jgi:hypothetical protein
MIPSVQDMKNILFCLGALDAVLTERRLYRFRRDKA